MKLYVLAGMLAISGMTALQVSADSYTTESRSPSIYHPQSSTTSDRHAPVHVGGTPRIAGYTDRTGYWRGDVQDKGSGNPMRVVGRIIGDTNRLTDRKLHLSLNGQRWTINAPDRVLSVGEHGEPLSIHDLHEGDWVVAEGRQIGDARIRALAIRKLGDDATGYRQSAFFQPEQSGGYAMTLTAGPNFRLQARESILGVQSQVAGERQEIDNSPKR